MSDQGKRTRSSRRTVLAGAGTAGVTALLGGCQTYGESAPAPGPAGVSAPDQDGTSAPGAAGDPASAAGTDPPDGAAGALAAVADIPVGGGRIFATEGVVVTQPTEGTIRAFSAKCTHQGCTVSSVRDRSIICACHNSAFDIADGSVKGGPANRPLPATAVTVQDGNIRLA